MEETATVSAGKPDPEWAALAAIDWGDQKHFWKLAPAGSATTEQGQLDHTPEAVEAWALDLRQRFGGRPIAVCLEQSRGALVYILAKHSHLVLFPVPPTMAANYRKTFTPSGAKADPSDASMLLDLLTKHAERLRPLRPDTVETRLLQKLCEQRECMVHEKTRESNRLTACLKEFFPQVLDWFDCVSAPLVAALLERWPTLQQLQRARPQTLRNFFARQNCRCADRIEQRIEAISKATAVTNDRAVLEGGIATAHGLLALLRTLRENIARLEEQIQQLVNEHPDGPLFASLPGAGAATVPRLIVAFGTDRDRYPTALQMQCYSGISPVKNASGGSCVVHFRRACPKFLRQTFHQFAAQSIQHSVWAKAYYDEQRRHNCKSHHAAVRALAYKWIRVIFRCWKDHQPYDEQTYLQSLERHRAASAAQGEKSKGRGRRGRRK